jgi:hypothetical protein
VGWDSIHGKEAEKKNLKTAVCSDCHTTHDIVGSSTDKAKLSITASCGDCHQDAFKSYKASYHGQVNTLGYTYTAKCFDCHGSHGIQPSTDPKSKMHEKNRLKTCQKCHSGKKDLPLATPGFLTFSPHGTSHDFDKYPQIWLTTKFMVALLVGVFAFFWSHSILWWIREYAGSQARQDRSAHPTDALPPEFKGKHVRRFGPMWRLAHLCFALSVMTLVLTGMAAFYAETGWAKAVMAAFGGPKNAGIGASRRGLHHAGHLLHPPDRGRRSHRAQLEGLQVLRSGLLRTELEGHVRHDRHVQVVRRQGAASGASNAGPTGRSSTIGRCSGVWRSSAAAAWLLAFPHVVANYLPGWIFNIAMVVHGEEAFLAAVFLFTVHFFNNHFRPDKLPPPDVVMFTGTQSLDEFRHEHGPSTIAWWKRDNWRNTWSMRHRPLHLGVKDSRPGADRLRPDTADADRDRFLTGA